MLITYFYRNKTIGFSIEKVFETIISELDKMDLQAAIGIGDSLFGGEFNRFYRSYRSHYKDLADARKAWGAVNNLTDEGRKGNEEYAASLNVLKESLFSALQDVSGHVGHELTPFVDSFNSAFNSIYRDSDQWLDEILSNFDVHLDDSYKNVAKWGAGIVGVLGGIFASYKVSGKILSGTKSVLQKAGIASPDVQKVFVVNMPASGLGGIDPSDGGSGGKGKGPRIPSSTTKTRALSSVLLRGVALEWGPAILKGGGALTLLASAKEYQPRNWNPNPGAAKTFYDNTLKEEKKSSLDIMNSEKAKDSLSVMYRNNDVVPIVPTVINNNGRDSEQLDKVNRSLERLIDLQEQSSTSNESSNSGLDHVSVMSTDGFNH